VETISGSGLVLFLALVLPGFLSMRVYALIHPVGDATLKDQLLEAIAFGCLNFALTAYPLSLLVERDFGATRPFLAYLLLFLAFGLVPIALPILLRSILRRLAHRRWVLQPYRTSWDAFFIRRQRCWMIIHLLDGRRLGGWFGENSFASLHPQPGHLYVEELWELDEQSRFTKVIGRSKGAVLRPTDYHFVEFFEEEDHGG
jgi:hypothetical protein